MIIKRASDVAVPALAGCLLLALWMAAVPIASATESTSVTVLAQGDPETSEERERLELDKLEQEILKLEAETAAQGLWVRLLVPLLGFAGVAFAAALPIAWQWRKANEERREDREQRERESKRAAVEQARDRQQREVQSRREFDQKLAGVIGSLASRNEWERANAATALRAFLVPEYPDYYETIYDVTVTHLRIEHPDIVLDLLRSTFERVLRLRLDLLEPGTTLAPDLSRTRLRRVDLTRLDLQGADLAFADLRHANLRGTILFRARGYGVDISGAALSRPDAEGSQGRRRELAANLEEARMRRTIAVDTNFHGARLVSARFEESDLTRADFREAKLQQAHFDGATLHGAKFQMANVSEADFRGATFGGGALRSLSRARNWRKALLDDEVRESLTRLSGN